MDKNKSSSKENKKFIVPDELPSTISECHVLIRAMEDYIIRFGHKDRRRCRDKFGPRSAQTPADTLSEAGQEIYNDAAAAVNAKKQQLGIAEDDTASHGGGGRTAPFAAKEESSVKHELAGESLKCKCCNIDRSSFGFFVSYQLEYIPARFKRIKHVEYRYKCPECKDIVQAQKPYQPIGKGYPGPGLLAHVITSKLAHHLPLYRQEHIFKNLGIPINRSQLSRWMKQSADEFVLLYDLMREKILEGSVIYCDETGMPYILKGNGKVKSGSIWIMKGGDDRPYNLYKFVDSKSGDPIEEFLAGYTGTVITDGTDKLDDLFAARDNGEKPAASARCWAHVYRKFEDAKHAEEKEADFALGLIKGLFKIEDLVLRLPEDLRLDVRDELSKPLLDKFKIWLDHHKEWAPPTSLRSAVEYTVSLWPGLCEFLNHASVKIHNNDAENALRPVVLGRNNWIFAGSAAGGQTTAILLSLVQTCRRLMIDPEEYLADLFQRMPGCPHTQLEQFLPDKWKVLREKQAQESVTSPEQKLSA